MVRPKPRTGPRRGFRRKRCDRRPIRSHRRNPRRRVGSRRRRGRGALRLGRREGAGGGRLRARRDPAAFDNGRAIDALRAATTAAGTQPSQPTLDDIAQIRRLHETRLEAEHRARRPLPKPGARRKFQYALTAETAALRLIGFGSYEAFSAVYGAADDAAAPTRNPTRRSRASRSCSTELGVDPHGDPLRAASEFLTTHESARLSMPHRRRRRRHGSSRHAMAERAATLEPEASLEPAPRRGRARTGRRDRARGRARC